MSGGRVVAVALAALLLAAEAAIPATPAEPGVHVVERGDTLFGLARRYRISVGALVEANHLPGERVPLRLGQRLTIPPPGPGTRPKRRIPANAARNLRETRGPVNLVLAIPDFLDIAPHFAWPSDGAVTSPFGRRRSGWHRGIDVRGERGTPVLAAAPGVVVVSGIEPRYGRVVKIEHDHGFMTVYAHNDENLVDVGDEVEMGDLIARMGRTGRATAEHVHFEIRRDGRVYNPLYLLPLPSRVGQVEDMEPDEADE